MHDFSSSLSYTAVLSRLIFHHAQLVSISQLLTIRSPQTFRLPASNKYEAEMSSKTATEFLVNKGNFFAMTKFFQPRTNRVRPESSCTFRCEKPKALLRFDASHKGIHLRLARQVLFGWGRSRRWRRGGRGRGRGAHSVKTTTLSSRILGPTQ